MARERDVWNRCDECGRFVAMEDLAIGAAKRTLVHPDTQFTAEKWENLCRRCNAPKPGPAPPEMRP